MNKKLLIFAIIYTLIMLVLGGVIISYITADKKESAAVNSAESISVEMNEIKNLIKAGETDAALKKSDEMIISSAEDTADNTSKRILLMWIFVAVNILGVFIVLRIIFIELR